MKERFSAVWMAFLQQNRDSMEKVKSWIFTEFARLLYRRPNELASSVKGTQVERNEKDLSTRRLNVADKTYWEVEMEMEMKKTFEGSIWLFSARWDMLLSSWVSKRISECNIWSEGERIKYHTLEILKFSTFFLSYPIEMST